jgi:hypothetical protein
MAQLTIDQIITLGELSITLSGNYEAQGDLYGKRLAYTSPTTIATITDALKWQYESFQDESTARGVANYLYWICGKFALEGQYIITGAGGGTVVPINPGSTPNPTEFEVTGSSIIPAGDSTVTISTYIGYNLLFVRNGIPQSQIDLGNSYYNWNKVTGQFICYGPAVEGELFQLYPFI